MGTGAAGKGKTPGTLQNCSQVATGALEALMCPGLRKVVSERLHSQAGLGVTLSHGEVELALNGKVRVGGPSVTFG
jgi:hypothetical protein